jgi:PAS domain S-box-containing protein
MALILMVEDSPVVAACVVRALELAGFRVIVAPDCATARQSWREALPDLVLMDIELPDGDGIQLMAELRAFPGAKNVPVVALSGFQNMGEAVLAAAGFDDFLSKPVSPALLVHAVRAQLPKPRAEGSQPGAGLQVLLVGEPGRGCATLDRHLGALGFEVLTARPTEGLKRLEVDRPHAVVADLPSAAPEVLDRVAAMCAEAQELQTPVVLVTGDVIEAADRHLALAIGAGDLVSLAQAAKELPHVLCTLIEAAPTTGVRPELATAAQPRPPAPEGGEAALRRELERQRSINVALAQRYATLSTELAVLTGISDAVSRSDRLDLAVEEVLRGCFDAGGLSAGAIYQLEPGGRLMVRVVSGAVRAALFESFCGHPEVLHNSIAAGVTRCFGLSDPGARPMLEATGTRWALLVPLIYSSEPIGALLMLSATRNLDAADWRALAQGVGNQVTQALVMARTVEERRLSEERAVEQATMLQAILDGIDDGVMVADASGRGLVWNRAAVALSALGLFDAGGGSGQGAVLCHADRETKVALDELPMTRALRGQEARLEVYLDVPGSEGGRHFTCFARPLQLADHGQCALVVFQDVTEKQRATRELLQSRAAWQALVESAPDEIIRVDSRGLVMFSNRAAADPERARLVGRPWLELARPEYHVTMLRALASAVEEGCATTYESALMAPSGQMVWSLTHIGPVREADRTVGAMLVVRDVTQRKAAEAQMIVGDRMASIGTLAAGVAHEINNPLAAVIANLDLAIRATLNSAEAPALVAELSEELVDARDSAERVRQIVRDLKLFSRVEDERRGPVSVERVLESTLRIVWNEIRHRARLLKDYQPVPLVDANDARLGQVFLNLLVNAAQAIPEGRATANQIKIATRMVDGRVVVEVSDTGSGMPPEVLARLYTPFFTTKPTGVGTGLGLSICQRIVTSLGGEIKAESEVGKGTTFRVSLPPSQAQGLRAPAMATVRAASRRGRVLVIDDEATIGTAVRRMLGTEHDVVSVTSGAAALERFHTGERFDVVLCDLMMPQITGMDVFTELVRQWPDQAARVVFLTGGAFTPRAREFLEKVQNRALDKPFEAQHLRMVVNELVG